MTHDTMRCGSQYEIWHARTFEWVSSFVLNFRSVSRQSFQLQTFCPSTGFSGNKRFARSIGPSNLCPLQIISTSSIFVSQVQLDCFCCGCALLPGPPTSNLWSPGLSGGSDRDPSWVNCCTLVLFCTHSFSKVRYSFSEQPGR